MIPTKAGRRRLAVLLCSSLAAACTARAPQAFYALSVVDTPTASTPLNVSVAVGPVSVPSYLNRPQLVERKGEHEFAVSEQHRWLESLDDGFARALAEDLGRRLGSGRVSVFPSPTDSKPEYRVRVDVARFEANRSSGEVELRARWSIYSASSSGADEAFTARAAFGAAAGGPTYAASVAAQSQLVGELADAIAAGIRALAAAE